MPDTTLKIAASAEEVAVHNQISMIIGSAMNDAFRNIMTKLQKADQPALSAMGAASVSAADLTTYFANLGGAQLELSLPCKLIKGSKCKFYGDPDDNQIKVMGVEGSISIGIGIKF